MAGYSADFAVTLPNQMPSVGELLQQQIQFNRQDKLRQEELALREGERLRQQEQQNRLYNLREIDADTDIAKFRTGERAFDEFSLQELDKIKRKALAEYVKLDPAEMEYRLQSDMKPYLQWYNTGKAAMENVKKGLTDLNKTLPNIDLPKAQALVMDMFTQDYLERGQDGSLKRKDPMFIQQRDYFSELQKPEVLGSLVNDTSPFFKMFTSVPTSSVGEKEYKNNKGKVKAFKWSGASTPFSELQKDEEGKPTGFALRSEEFPAVKGMKLLPQDIYDQMKGNPMAWAAGNKLWNDFKAQRGIQPSNEAEEDILKRSFFYEQAKDKVPHGFKTEEIEKIPPPRITVNVGGSGKKNDTNDFVLRFKQAMENGSVEDMVEVGRSLYAGNGINKLKDIAVNNNDRGITIYYTDKDGIDQEQSLKPDDPNFFYKLAGLYQQFTGSDAKLEGKVLNNKADYGNKKNSKPKTAKKNDPLGLGL